MTHCRKHTVTWFAVLPILLVAIARPAKADLLVDAGEGGPEQSMLADVQKQSDACGQDPAWRAVEEGARPEFSGSHVEKLHARV